MNPSNESQLIWLRLPGLAQSLEPFRDFVLAQARGKELPDALQLKIDLVLEEVLLNIFDNAFEEAGQVAVGCGMDPDKGYWLRVSDPGPAFNPLENPPPDTGLDIDERPVGGLGIHLAREMSSHMDYQRRDGQNILDIFFRVQ